MTQNEQLRLHNILILFPEDLTQKVKEAAEIIGSKFQNNYFVGGVNNPHIALLTIALKDSDTIEFVNKVKELSNKINSFEVTLERLRIVDKKYIFIEFDQKTNAILSEINKLFNDNFISISRETMKRYYESNGYDLNARDYGNIHNFGNKYSFAPHITLFKANENNAHEALELAKSTFNNFDTFEVDKFEITKEDYKLGKLLFPTVGIAKLGV